MSFRLNDDYNVFNPLKIRSIITRKIGICKLDSNFRYITNTFFTIKHEPYIDGRLSWVNDKLLLTFTSDIENVGVFGTFIMDLSISNEFIDSDLFRITPENYPGIQKNWTNFIYNDELYFIKKINPHFIYKYDLDNKKLIKISEIDWESKWLYDLDFRGNANPVKLPDGNFLSTFHTTLNTTINNINYRFYDNGFYIFEGKPPFKPIKMMTQTFLPAESCDLTFNWQLNPYANSNHQKFLCVFPIGMIINNNNIIVSYGNSDKFIDVATYSLNEIMNLMVNI